MCKDNGMNDTHGQQGQGWYGFDLDGTLAEYHGWKGIDHIGDPIWPMVDLIKRYHDEGRVVKIMTARVSPRRMKKHVYGGGSFRFDGHFPFIHFADAYETCEQFEWEARNDSIAPEPEDWDRVYAHDYINEWCDKHLGFRPEIVHQKDPLMLWLFDDRVVQVEPNTGKILGKMPE